MARTLVDTSAWIEYLRGTGSDEARRVEELLVSDDALVCDLVLVELWNGARGEREKRGLEKLQQRLECLPVDRGTWSTAISLARLARASGIIVPATDVVIASSAAAHGVALLHRDGDFDALEPLVKKLHVT